MIIFELTMPGIGSWNGKWTGSNRKYYRSRKNSEVPKEVVGKSFDYNWSDGWCANVSVSKVTSTVERKLMKESAGFCGYDWMIRSIIKHGCIRLERE